MTIATDNATLAESGTKEVRTEASTVTGDAPLVEYLAPKLGNLASQSEQPSTPEEGNSGSPTTLALAPSVLLRATVDSS